METKLALISIVVEKSEPIDEVNSILHDYAGVIVSRLGVPYHKRNVSIICIVMDAPEDDITVFTQKLSSLPNIDVNKMYANIPSAAGK